MSTSAADLAVGAPRHPAVLTFEDDAWYSGPELAERLGIAHQTLHNRRSTGASLPDPVRVGNRHYYSGREINAWLDRQRVAK